MKFLGLILISLSFVAPWLFEARTFQLYAEGSPDFFTYSGSRLPFFIVSCITLGYFGGRNIPNRARFHLYALASLVATVALIISLYHACDPRQCYYAAPAGLGEIRLGVMLASSSQVGLVLGAYGQRLSKNSQDEVQGMVSVNPYLGAVAVAVFAGLYPASLLYSVPSEPATRTVLFAYYVIVPFVLSGLVFQQLSLRRIRPFGLMSMSVITQTLLFVLFAVPENLSSANTNFSLMLIGLAVGMLASWAASLAGVKLSAYLKHHPHEFRNSDISPAGVRDMKLTAAVYAIIFASFTLFAMHPQLLAPIDLMTSLDYPATGKNGYLEIMSPVSTPAQYTAAANNERYFPTKRVEVDIDFASISNKAAGGTGYLLAGMGAQSPNCCKDGLDYGYRADVLLSSNGQRYVLARAWETCDQNLACSGFAWHSVMHESMVPVDNIGSSLSLAMEWAGDERIANWYYRSQEDQSWVQFSSFRAPDIENPFFNLGVMPVNDLLPFLGSNVKFFQSGISATPEHPGFEGRVIFHCPAYYDMDGNKHCFPTMTPVPAGHSEWKVLWGWGVDWKGASVEIDNSESTVGITL